MSIVISGLVRRCHRLGDDLMSICPIMSRLCPNEGYSETPVNIGLVPSVPSVPSLSTLREWNGNNGEHFKEFGIQWDAWDRWDNINGNRSSSGKLNGTSLGHDGTSNVSLQTVGSFPARCCGGSAEPRSTTLRRNFWSRFVSGVMPCLTS